MPRLQIMDTTIRDGQQSLWATRMQIGDMLPILPKMDQRRLLGHRGVGRGDVRLLPALPGREPLGASARHQGEHAQHAARHARRAGRTSSATSTTPRRSCTASSTAAHRNGVEVFRVFDALNDIRNVVDNAEAIKECGGHVRGRHLLHDLARCTRWTATWNTASSSRIWAPTPSPSRTWPACSRPIAPSAW